MRYQINSFDYLKNAISDLHDDREQWRDYPCVIWERGKSMGYGSLGTNQGGSTYAHWMAFEITYGAIPDGCRVRHRCGIHACFRPSHLYAHGNFQAFNESLSGIVIDPIKKWTDYPCLLWRYGVGSHGYGDVATPEGKDMAHRLSYKKFYGEPGSGLFVCHYCDTPRCYHPAHLFAGTPLDNVHDMFSKGRQPNVKGEHAGTVKLTDTQVLEIRSLYESGMTQLEISKRFPVDRSTVGYIVRRIRWTHI